MSDQNNLEKDWRACPQGALIEMVRCERTRKRNEGLVRFGGTAAAVLLVGMTVTLAVNHLTGSRENTFGGISCTDCRSLLAGYQANTLDTAVKDQVATHLDRCDYCRSNFERMMRPMEQSRSSAPQANYFSFFQSPSPRRLARIR